MISSYAGRLSEQIQKNPLKFFERVSLDTSDFCKQEYVAVLFCRRNLVFYVRRWRGLESRQYPIPSGPPNQEQDSVLSSERALAASISI